MSKDIQEAMSWLSALDIKSEYEATNKELILNYIENSIPTEVIEEEIKKLKDMFLVGTTIRTARDFAVAILQNLLENK